MRPSTCTDGFRMVRGTGVWISNRRVGGRIPCEWDLPWSSTKVARTHGLARPQQRRMSGGARMGSCVHAPFHSCVEAWSGPWSECSRPLSSRSETRWSWGIFLKNSRCFGVNWRLMPPYVSCSLPKVDWRGAGAATSECPETRQAPGGWHSSPGVSPTSLGSRALGRPVFRPSHPAERCWGKSAARCEPARGLVAAWETQ